MKTKIICILLIVSLFVLCLPIAACSGGKEETIRLNEVTHSVFYAPLYVLPCSNPASMALRFSSRNWGLDASLCRTVSVTSSFVKRPVPAA